MYRKTFLLFIIVILLLQFNSHIYCDRIEKKDPFLAGVLSWYMPGLGQFYSGKYLRGSIFWTVENTLLIFAVLTVADMNFSVDEEIGFQFSIKPKETITDRQKTIGIFLFISYGALHVLNVVDAIRIVKRSNSTEELRSRIYLNYMNIADNSHYMLNYKF